MNKKALIISLGFSTGAALATNVNCSAQTNTEASPDDNKFKSSVNVELKPSQSKLFTMGTTIVRTTIKDPDIAEPVVLSQHEVLILGKAEGTTNLVIRDEKGESLGVAILVLKRHGSDNNLPITAVSPIRFDEIKTTKTIPLKISQSSKIELKDRVVRTSVSNPNIAEIEPTAENGITIKGKSRGWATLFVWDRQGTVEGIDLHIGDHLSETSNSPKVTPKKRKVDIKRVPVKLEMIDVECWTGDQKKIWQIPALARYL
jgi:Flp pilus assembly secretin CpaC